MSKTQANTHTTYKKTLSGKEVIEAIFDDGSGIGFLNLGEWSSAYSLMFWRPYLGLPAYALYQTLLALAETAVLMPDDTTTIEMMVRMVGQGNRHTILGRKASGSRPAQDGTIRILEDAGLVRHWQRRDGRQREHAFEVLPVLPVLTPFQAESLARPLADKHERFIGAIRGFDVVTWRKLDAETLTAKAVEQHGMVRAGR